jgi:hypothetical protein
MRIVISYAREDRAAVQPPAGAPERAASLDGIPAGDAHPRPRRFRRSAAPVPAAPDDRDRPRHSSAGIPVFLSYPTPHQQAQKAFLDRVVDHLLDRGLEPRTLGVTNYDMDAPLKAIRRLMLESNGLITIAFARHHIASGASRAGADIPGCTETPREDVHLTSPWSQIEPAMAFQVGLPVLILREAGVLAEGVLEQGVLGTYMPLVDLSTPLDDYFDGVEWRHLIARWESQVRAVVEAKGNPPRLF